VASTLRLNPIRCGGYGTCAAVLPERISLDEWGYPMIDSGPIEEHLVDQARRAVDACPVLALSLRRNDAPPATRAPEPASRV
jgi:ferredoxin